MIVEPAPAKINLFLHIGQCRADGLHDLLSLFIFTKGGDQISVAPADELSLRVDGPFAEAIDGPVEDNLVWKAALLLAGASGHRPQAAITLHKNLPVAAGIGGGSADAAAALRALVRLWSLQMAPARLHELAFQLGADVPACLEKAPVAVSGAGEILAEGPALPPLWVCLVNPRIPMPTGPIFRAFDAAHKNPPAPAAPNLRLASYAALSALMQATRNDLERFAMQRAPVIGAVNAFLERQPGALSARMSGSGATSFAIFTSHAAADRAARSARARGWWALATQAWTR